MNALARGALRQFTQRLWIEHPTFELGGGHFTTELLPTQIATFEHRENRLAACLLHTMLIAVVSECLWHLKAQYPVQLPDICSG